MIKFLIRIPKKKYLLLDSDTNYWYNHRKKYVQEYICYIWKTF